MVLNTLHRILTIILIFTLSKSAFAEVIEKSLVGTWATEDSVFQGDRLIGGTVLYLSENAKAAMVGAPLPVGRCEDGRVCTPILGFPLTVTDVNENMIYLTTPSDGQDTITMVANYDSTKNVLLVKASNGESLRLVHLKSTLPDSFKQD